MLYKFFNSAKEFAEYLVYEVRDHRIWLNMFNLKFSFKYNIIPDSWSKQDHINHLVEDIEDRIKFFPIGFKYEDGYEGYDTSILPYRDAINENIKELTKQNEKYLNRVKENLNKIDELLKKFVE